MSYDAALVLNSRDYPLGSRTAAQVGDAAYRLAGSTPSFIVHTGSDSRRNPFGWAVRSQLQPHHPYAIGVGYDTCFRPGECGCMVENVEYAVTHTYNLFLGMAQVVRDSNPYAFIFMYEGDRDMLMAARMVEAAGIPMTVFTQPRPKPEPKPPVIDFNVIYDEHIKRILRDTKYAIVPITYSADTV